jgi:glycosyltransferase involved in cell wall biosynthesis
MNLNNFQSPVVTPPVLSTPGLESPPSVFPPLRTDNSSATLALSSGEQQSGIDAPSRNKRSLRTLFVITSMPVGGAETLLVNMLDRFDRRRIVAEVACLKSPGPLGEAISDRHQIHSDFLSGKWDLRVLPRLARLMRERNIDAVITIGAGDKMFWGRLAAKCAGVPVICSALHSTGWPDGVGRKNRLLTQITDGFIAVADHHGAHLIKHERFPEKAVHIIRNGIDCQRFVPSQMARAELRRELSLSDDARLVGIVAALRPEKNHAMFVAVAATICEAEPNVHFLIVGDGPERVNIEQAIDLAGIQDRVHLLGTRHDTPAIVAGLDIFLLTSHNEASPVSILEALSCGVPVISTHVGSVAETVRDGETGYLVATGDTPAMVRRTRQLLGDQRLRQRLGEQGRDAVMSTGSLDSMVQGYTRLVESLYEQKTTT